jgi:hypothetical protein
MAMDATALPLVDGLMPVTYGLETLTRWQRSGLVCETRGPIPGSESYRLLYIGRLLEAVRDNTATLSMIEGGYPVYILQSHDITTHQLDLVRPLQTVWQYQNFFAHPTQRGRDYALAAAVPGVAVVVTRHETDKSRLESGTGGFKCNGTPFYHGFPDPDVTVDQPCPKYPECSLPGGGWPKIVPA